MAKYKILVVDDEDDLCEILKFNLENEGYEVDTASSAEDALKMNLSRYNLLILDVMMGEISGFRMARMLKESSLTADIPIIFLTAKDTENDTLTGLSLGADDYISKPFSLREVSLRVKNVLHRTAFTPESENMYLSFNALQLNLRQKTATLYGKEFPLTKTEFEILQLLLENEGQVFSRADILRRIWSDDVLVLDRTVDVNITRLRKKLGKYGCCIATRTGYGYYFDAKADVDG
jgi:two-component system alkaline phosphatase synthesis response regulator PhoP